MWGVESVTAAAPLLTNGAVDGGGHVCRCTRFPAFAHRDAERHLRCSAVDNDDDAADRSTADTDAQLAWSLAANCLLYEEDPGPAMVNVGSDTEPSWMPRDQAWRYSFANYLVERLAADHRRLSAALVVAQQQLREARSPRSALAVYRVRRSDGEGLGEALRVFGPSQWRDRILVQRRTVDLCQQALQRIVDAGADHDDQARQRLLAVLRHTNTLEALGAVPGVPETSMQQLAADLDDIERGPGDNRNDDGGPGRASDDGGS